MDSKILKIIPIYRDGKRVGKTTLKAKVLKSALKSADYVKALQGAIQINADIKGVEKTDFGGCLPETAAECDSVVISALYDCIENNKERLNAVNALDTSKGGHALTEEGLIAGYCACLSSLETSIKALVEAHEALIGRYREIMSAHGDKIAKEQE